VSYTLDANVLLYASDEASPLHARSLDVVTGAAQGPEIVYLFWPTIMAYLRIATHPTVFRRPLSIVEAVGNVEALIGRPHVQAPGEDVRFWRRFREVVADAAPSGNLVPDAHLVSLMLDNGVRTIWTHDRDYRRSAGSRSAIRSSDTRSAECPADGARDSQGGTGVEQIPVVQNVVCGAVEQVGGARPAAPDPQAMGAHVRRRGIAVRPRAAAGMVQLQQLRHVRAVSRASTPSGICAGYPRSRPGRRRISERLRTARSRRSPASGASGTPGASRHRAGPIWSFASRRREPGHPWPPKPTPRRGGGEPSPCSITSGPPNRPHRPHRPIEPALSARSSASG